MAFKQARIRAEADTHDDKICVIFALGGYDFSDIAVLSFEPGHFLAEGKLDIMFLKTLLDGISELRIEIFTENAFFGIN
ncbi:hypothetical protein D3C80_1791370 [compost metagenome]